ncbi:TetR/AcrR family transcriptional regulator [Brenneria rubrifaciens]|uniref:TetR/AcrR family transcriptional regulator n=1 Tax=Brenneria rubrifaciens TaxID=55213 RepID=A0A4P8QQ56_9GAMM|nr:TetR/AcrR family transcriptional regulator [Brenneria rubrifaciens]QCR09108.1 TetR/AcrR family transcriptional regulator [Brenneria rubrifaciens]
MKVRTKARRDAIVQTAAQLFQEMGYERASMNELAKRVGGSKATLYGYFSTKEELFIAVVREHATMHLSEATQELIAEDRSTETLKDLLTRFGERILFVLTNESSAMAIYRMVVAEAGHSDIGTLFYEAGPKENIEKLSELMAEAMEKKTLRKDDPSLKAVQFLSLLTAEIDGRVFQRHLEPISLPRIREMVSNAVDMFIAGAGPRP